MLGLILSMILWGTLGLFVLWSGMAAVDVAFYRCLIGALVMGCWMIKSKEKIEIDKNFPVVALAGICLVLNWIFLFKSFQVSSITIGNMSYYLQPVILIILGIFFYNEKVSFKQWIFILLALCGVLLTMDLHQLNSPNVVLGATFALFAALLYSFVTLLMKRVNLSYFKVIFIQLSIGMLILLPFVHFQPLSLVAIVCLVVIGTVHTLLAYFLYYGAIKKTDLTKVAILSYLDPIVAIASDILFFNRQLDVYQIIGIFLTFGALYLLVMMPRSSMQIRVVESISA
ncbi:MAG: EamA family transporter [Gammaproteobacteria bacterium]